jgi:hypothetical protein
MSRDRERDSSGVERKAIFTFDVEENEVEFLATLMGHQFPDGCIQVTHLQFSSIFIWRCPFNSRN